MEHSPLVAPPSQRSERGHALFESVTSFLIECGSVTEWTIVAVLKTVGPKGSVGSNPTTSANLEGYPI